jgi:SAM-dependent methyltransferase
VRAIASQLHGRVLDYGCGYGRDVVHLRGLGLDATGYDPASGMWKRLPHGVFDHVLVVYVVNVIPGLAQRIAVVAQAWSYVAPGGRLWLAARTSQEVHASAVRGHWGRCGDGWCSGHAWQGGQKYIDLVHLVAKLPHQAGVQRTHQGAPYMSILVARSTD